LKRGEKGAILREEARESMSSHVSRRAVLGAIGSGAAACGLAVSGDALAGSLEHHEAQGAEGPEALVAGIKSGTKLAGSIVLLVEPLAHGAIAVMLAAPSGEPFRLEIMRRDASAIPRAAPGRTERFAVYVVNRGDGAVPTVEAQGLAAMALANHIATVEERVDARLLLTHAERLAQHGAILLERRG
jgi:hypothetical protein